MNPAYPPQPYHQPTGPPPPYGLPANSAGQPPAIGWNPSLYAQPQPAYAPTSHYGTAAPQVSPYAASPYAASPYAASPYAASPYAAPTHSPAPVAPTYATVPYNAQGAYTPNQPTYIQQPQPGSNLTVVQPTRTVYMTNPVPDAGLGFLAGAALAGGHHHHHHHGWGHHGGLFGHHGGHHGGHHFGGHGFGHHGFGGHHC